MRTTSLRYLKVLGSTFKYLQVPLNSLRYLKVLGSSLKEDEITQIPLKKSTRARLRDIGKKGETYDTIINRLIDNSKKKK